MFGKAGWSWTLNWFLHGCVVGAAGVCRRSAIRAELRDLLPPNTSLWLRQRGSFCWLSGPVSVSICYLCSFIKTWYCGEKSFCQTHTQPSEAERRLRADRKEFSWNGCLILPLLRNTKNSFYMFGINLNPHQFKKENIFKEGLIKVMNEQTTEG